MTNVLLCSEDYVKTNSELSDNYFGKWLLPAIRESQNIYLQETLGTCLYNKIIDLVVTKEIKNPENIAYKHLLDDYIRIYLMYVVLAETVTIANAKIANIGVVQANDEHIVTLSQKEQDLLQHNFRYKADFYCRRLQEYLLNNLELFPELDCCACEKMKANLTSSESCGIFLGGIYYKK